MSLRRVLVWLRCIIIAVAILSTTYLYLYPVVHGCAFSSTTGSTYDGFKNALAHHRGHLSDNDEAVAPFRLLVLADPQLEGDSSLPDPEDALLARIGVHRRRLAQTSWDALKDAYVDVVKELALEDIPRAFWAARKTLDLFGNDYYLAHIYRTLHWWTDPTHVTVLGDLIGSQWVSDDEFAWRGWRYWNRVFAGSHKVEEMVMNMHEQDVDKQSKFPLEEVSSQDWSRLVVNIAGNHDIGYAGDISRSRLDRFESTFGKANWDIKFTYPAWRISSALNSTDLPTPEIHLIILDSMLLDTPVLDESLQGQTYTYINNLITQRLSPVESRNTSFTLLLTHVPLHKPEGICVDAPFFDFWDFEAEDGAFKSGGLKEQNHLSEHTSQNGVLRAIYGMSGDLDAPLGGRGRNGLILNGHDHEGCDVVHYVERTTSSSALPEKAQQEARTDEQEVEKSESSTSADKDAHHEQISSWTWKSSRHHDFTSAETRISSPQAETEREVGAESEITTSLREITLRSMMGSYSGNAGLLSLWYDFDAGNWDYSIMMCPLGVQHTWWAIHVLDIVAMILILAQILGVLYPRVSGSVSSGESKGGSARMIEVVKKRVETEEREVGEGHQKQDGRSTSRRRRKG